MAEMEAIGFKEWAYVCEALAQGVQSIILRKGGIHEGRKGFQFQHDRFWLFPTGFHAQAEQLRWMPDNAAAVMVPQDEQRESVEIRGFAEMKGVWRVTDWDKVSQLDPLHVWTEDVVKERFEWNEDSCLHIALVRVSVLSAVWSFPYERGYGGCRSWVKLPADGVVKESQLTTVLSDEAWLETAAKVKSILE